MQGKGYEWYEAMREVKEMQSTGWGMGVLADPQHASHRPSALFLHCGCHSRPVGVSHWDYDERVPLLPYVAP
jgi:hypothetical protein